MSILSNKTEKAALTILARTLKYFDQLAQLAMTAEDSFDARSAENLISGILETGGYEAVHRKGKGTMIQKIKSETNSKQTNH